MAKAHTHFHFHDFFGRHPHMRQAAYYLFYAVLLIFVSMILAVLAHSGSDSSSHSENSPAEIQITEESQL